MSIVKRSITAFLCMSFIALTAQTSSGSVKIKGTRFTYPIFNKWIQEFNKSYPNIKVEIAPKAPADSIDLSIAAYKLTEEDYKGNRDGVTLNRYAQLPVVNSQKADLKVLQAKGYTEQELKQLYFHKETKATASSVPQLVTVYRREIPACASVSFAKHFGSEFKDLNGVGVNGDDQDLLKAVKKDPNGISYNNLGFIYNLTTRKVVDSIAVVPLDLNENGKIDASERIYNTLDEVITFVESNPNSKIPVEGVNVIFSKDSKNTAARLFLDWVLTQGQQYNHELGFLNQEAKTLAQQKERVLGSFKN